MANPTGTILATYTREGYTAHLVLRPDGSLEIPAADADINADGSAGAYSPGDKGSDFLANAKDEHGRFVGVLTDIHGNPLTQGPDDPRPGFYISSTSYEWPDQPPRTQRRYVDGSLFPFAVVPLLAVTSVPGAVKGAKCVMTNLKNGKVCMGFVGDTGPRTKVGEVSPAAARILGLDPSPKFGGTDEPIIRYEIYPGVHGIADGKSVPLMRMNGTYIV